MLDLTFSPCPINPEHTIVSSYPGCRGCDTERQIKAYAAELLAKREEKIADAVEIARRIIPLVVEAIRQYDEESRK